MGSSERTYADSVLYTRKNYLSNLRCTFEDPLTDEEMELLKKADKNCRLIKGQVFLWEGADTWEDLWDIDGTIPGWHGYEKKQQWRKQNIPFLCF